MITGLYTSILALLLCWLSLNVIKARRKNRVKYADGGVEELQIARSAQSNAVDYCPITILLLLLLELSNANIWLIHCAGVVFVAGRIIHARGILTDNLRKRVLGMQLTIFTIIPLAILNIICFFNRQILPLF